MPSFNGIEDLRKIEWSKSYLWDIQFENAPSPFNDWFPASEVTENVANLNSMPFEGGNSSFKIPQSRTSNDISITFSDDVNNTLYNWLKTWIESTTAGYTVATLSECTKVVHIKKLDSKKNVIETNSYRVYPEGTLPFSNNSNPDIRQYTLMFNIVGVLNPRSGRSNNSNQQPLAPL